MDELNALLDIFLQPGSLGENITTLGLGSLGDVVPGTKIGIGDHIVLTVTEQNDPCKNINVYHPLLVKQSYGRRGICATVSAGGGSIVSPGMPIEIMKT